MGMGVFTGRFKEWDWLFITLAIAFCLISRVFNTVPFSFIANLWRARKISANMQVVMWFAGLRGAIAFALSASMPGPSKDIYQSTTLMVVIFTTLVCGGLTEPLLHRMDVKAQHSTADQVYEQLTAHDMGDEEVPENGSLWLHERKGRRSGSHGRVEGLWKKVDTMFLKPLFGGSPSQQGAHKLIGLSHHPIVRTPPNRN
ncbi:unnamed protein product [Choristocarpus tenellus]